MSNSRELAIQSFTEGLLLPHYSPASKNNSLLWKSLLISVILLFVLVYQPRTEALEISLTGDNLLQIINQDRVNQGLRPLRANLRLQQAAAEKARHIFRNNYFAHTSPDGVAPWDFIKDSGLNFRFAGENLALNYTSSYELEKDFLQSQSHRENLLSPIFSDIGIAVVNGLYQGQPAVITVEMFATPQDQLAAQN